MNDRILAVITTGAVWGLIRDYLNFRVSLYPPRDRAWKWELAVMRAGDWALGALGIGFVGASAAGVI